MPNLFKQFLDLIPDPSQQVGEVVAISDGIATIELPDGGRLNATGAATVGQQVFVRGGVIEGAAPSLPVDLIEV